MSEFARLRAWAFMNGLKASHYTTLKLYMKWLESKRETKPLQKITREELAEKGYELVD